MLIQITLALLIMMTMFGCAAPSPELRWRQIPSLPDKEGFASPFAGYSNGRLIVAGGANFPAARPWEGGQKVWYDGTFVLNKLNGKWATSTPLPRRTAYGVSVTQGDSVVCIGGGDASRHFTEVYRLRYREHEVKVVPLASLPRACAFMSGALLGETVYVLGGIETPNATTCLKTFWAMDLSAQEPKWRELPACPGPERMLAVMGAADDAVYVFSGAQLHAAADGKPMRKYLRDGWCFRPGRGWTQLAEMPRAAVAAPSPAPYVDGKFLVVSGDDGAHVGFKPETEHPGFPRDVLGFDPKQNRWSMIGTSAISRATAPTAMYERGAIIVSGEARPAYRSPEVWLVQRGAE